MRNNKSLSDDLLKDSRGSEGSASWRSNRVVATEKTDPYAAHHAEENPPKPFKPRRIDFTPDAPVNIGYVGGIQKPKSRA